MIDHSAADGGRAAGVEGNIQSSAGVADFLRRIGAALKQNGFEKLGVLIDNADAGGFATTSSRSSSRPT